MKYFYSVKEYMDRKDNFVEIKSQRLSQIDTQYDESVLNMIDKRYKNIIAMHNVLKCIFKLNKNYKIVLIKMTKSLSIV